MSSKFLTVQDLPEDQYNYNYNYSICDEIHDNTNASFAFKVPTT